MTIIYPTRTQLSPRANPLAAWCPVDEPVEFAPDMEAKIAHAAHNPLVKEPTCPECIAEQWGLLDPRQEALKRCEHELATLRAERDAERQKRLRVVNFSRTRLTRHLAAVATSDQIVAALQTAAREGDATVTRLHNTVKALEGFLNDARAESALLREGVEVTRTFLDTWSDPMGRNHEKRFVEVSAKFHELQRINAEREKENAALSGELHHTKGLLERTQKEKRSLEIVNGQLEAQVKDLKAKLLQPLQGGKDEKKHA